MEVNFPYSIFCFLLNFFSFSTLISVHATNFFKLPFFILPRLYDDAKSNKRKKKRKKIKRLNNTRKSPSYKMNLNKKRTHSMCRVLWNFTWYLVTVVNTIAMHQLNHTIPYSLSHMQTNRPIHPFVPTLNCSGTEV